MRDITVLRVEADSGVLRRLLGKLPGVEVVETLAESGVDGGPDTAASEAAPVAETSGRQRGSDDSGGLVDRVKPDTGLTETVVPETDVLDEETASVVREYGLLGAGVSFVVAGLVSVGLWAYKRRSGDGEAETPPPATEFEPESTTPAPTETSLGEESGSRSGAGSMSEDSTPEPAGRTEADREDVEWTTRDREPSPASSEVETGVGVERDDEAESDEDPVPRPGESLDPAPLLGMAFIAVSGALVRWLQDSDDER